MLIELKKIGIETRPIVSGNITRNKMIQNSDYKIKDKLINAEIIDKRGIMIGNRSTQFNKKDKKALINLRNIIESY